MWPKVMRIRELTRWPVFYGALIALTAFVCPHIAFAAPSPGTPITNQASADYTDPLSTQTVSIASSTVRAIVSGGNTTPPTIKFFATTSYDKIAIVCHAGSPAYVQATADSCNTNSTAIETRAITVASTLTGDSETLTATETGPNTGIFRVSPNIPTRNGMENPVVSGNGIVETVANDTLTAQIVDCATASAEVTILVDPAGVVFDSQNNVPVANAVVTLLDASMGVPAVVFADDGVTPAPSTVTTGVDGAFRFPLVAAGAYRLRVQPPPGYTAPSAVAIGDLPAGRVIEPDGSYLRNFIVTGSLSVVVVDVPVDPGAASGFGLFVQKTASRNVVEITDLLDYTVNIKNVSGTNLTAVTLSDALPAGFAYRRGTARLGGVKITDPVGSAGPRLAFALGAIADNETVSLTYRVRVGPGALQGNGINNAQANSTAPIVTGSNVARARVRVQGGVFSDRGVIIGKVFVDANGNRLQDSGEPGIPGVRLYLEDGTFAITDSEGKYSFFGIAPRTHVIKVDATSLPRGARLVNLTNRHGNDPATLFVDLKRGQMQKANFAIRGDSPEILGQVNDRRARGETNSSEIEYRLKQSLTADGTLPQVGDPKALPASGFVETPNFVPTLPNGALNSANTSLMREPVATVATENLEAVVAPLTSELGFIGLNDGDTLPMAQANVRVKGRLGTKFILKVNDAVVTDARVGKRVQLAEKQLEAWEFIGIPLKPGANTLELAQQDSFGNVRGKKIITVTAPDKLAKIKILLQAGDFPADGHSTAVVTVQLEDAHGVPVTARTPVTLEASLGTWQVEDLDKDEPGVQAFLEGGRAAFVLQAPQEPGDCRIIASSGALKAEATLPFLPHLRPMLAVGLIEGAINLNRLDPKSILPARKGDGFEEELRSYAFSSDDGRITGGGRAALYLKGQIKGEYLLTAAYDSEKDTGARLFRDIQPDEFYPVYGDSSVHGYDAQSTGRLYVRVDKKKSYALYGDITTQSESEARGLGNYSRSLTGVKTHYESERVSANVWAAYDTTRQVVEELPANGTSGPYYFNTPSGLLNSEKVEILVRDGQQPSVVLSATTMTRFSDYEFEPFTGRILFRAPVPSLDENLNPISIRVTYEVDQGGDKFWVYGTDAQFKLTPRLEIGGAAVRDENPLARYQLYSANTTWKLANTTFLLGEVAQSHAEGVGSGYGERLELRHATPNTDARVYIANTDNEFSNPNSVITAGRLEVGAKITQRLGDKTRLVGEALHTTDKVNDTERTGGEIEIQRTLPGQVRADVGLRHLLETLATGDHNEVNSVRTRVTAPVPHVPAASVYGEYENDIQDTSRHMIAAGGEYQIKNRTRIYARHEFVSEVGSPVNLGDTSQRNTTVVGVDTAYMKDGQMFNEYRMRDAANGREAEASIGLRNGWQLGDGVRLQTTFERINPIQGNKDNESTAVTGGIEYTRNPDWKGTARLELRRSTQADTLLNTLGYARKLDAEWTFLGKTILQITDNQSPGVGDVYQGRIQLGMAYRPASNDTWNALFKYEYKFEDDNTNPSADNQRHVNVLSALWNWQPTAEFQVSALYATKIVLDNSGNDHEFDSAHLTSGRITYDLTRRVDIGLNASALFDGKLRSVQYGFGPEVGFLVMKNLRVGVGYNFLGFRDEDLAESGYTNPGFFLNMRLKFDEGLFDFGNGRPKP